ESMERVQQMDDIAMQQAMERDLVMQQQMAMEHRGPVMRR
ncbi:hypothetical protein FHW69_003684, partial [Luteibacter sp. Sphag1AF]|nr:hypothetical protein [Luteibacter sp. Sphag1AF]